MDTGSMDDATSFGYWLRQRRRALDLTQVDLAARVGCSEIAIRKFESDERTPSRQVAALLAAGLELAEHERAAFVAFARGRRQLGATAEQSSAAPTTPGGRPDRLPLPLTRLLGREQEVALICSTLSRDDVRILTLVGPPGIGKTRLSLEAAAAMSNEQQGERFRDGVVFVSLAPVSDAGLVLDAIAQALQVSEGGGLALIERLIGAVREQALLLVLDNFEHVLAAGTQLARLLAACSGVKVLATSRAALHIRGEHLFPVAPLALPAMAWPLNTAEVQRSPAVQLFIERAQAVQPRFVLGDENAATVAAICARLDGLPLAIELVAASSRLLSPLALLARLGEPLGLLVAGPSDLPQRHRTLRAAIAWSHNLLAPAERRLYQRLGVFVGEYDLEAITEICADSGPQAAPANALTPASILDSLDVLIDHSLVSYGAPCDAEPRFMMLETIREHALEQLGASGEVAALRDRHARYYLSLAEQAEPHLSGEQQDSWLDRLEREHEQFRSALTWCLAGATARNDSFSVSPRPVRQDRRVWGLRLGAALWRFWHTRCHLREGRRWLEALLAADESMRPARVRVLLGTGILSSAQGDTAPARELLEQCMAEARRHGDDESLALALYHLGTILHNQGQVEPAIAALEQCLSLQRARQDTAGVANALNGLGNLLFGRDDARAVVVLKESVALQRQVGNTRGIAFALHSLGYACLLQGRPLDALPHFHEALLLFMQLGDKIGIADCLSGLAAVAGGRLQHEYAAQLWQAAEQLRDAIGALLSSAERAEYERYLDPQALTTARHSSPGDGLLPEQVIADAIALVGTREEG